MYAADLLILTSLWEGSPDVIKEAMVCNLPIVSTDVGDVKELFGNVSGCCIAQSDKTDFIDKIKLVLKYSEKKEKTMGRQGLLTLGLDSETIAKKIKTIYGELKINES